jgi:hypothetical protein
MLLSKNYTKIWEGSLGDINHTFFETIDDIATLVSTQIKMIFKIIWTYFSNMAASDHSTTRNSMINVLIWTNSIYHKSNLYFQFSAKI